MLTAAATQRGICVHLGPLEYLGRVAFTQENFPDIYLPIWVASLVFFIGTIILYNVRVRQLHRHEPLRALQEWLLWTGLITFCFVLVGTMFNFYFLFILGALIVGIATLVWIRFFRFPPYIQAYNYQLRRARFFSQSNYKAAEATFSSKRARGSQRRRRA
jgi:phosphatidylserine synthase